LVDTRHNIVNKLKFSYKFVQAKQKITPILVLQD